MAKRVAKANLYDKEGPFSRTGSYIYYVHDAKPTDAITNASPPFPGGAVPGTPLWNFVDDLSAGTTETEHPDAMAFGVIVVSVRSDYLSPHHFTESVVTIGFATSPKVGFSGTSMLPAVRWNGQSSIEYKTVYNDLSNPPLLVPEGMSIALPILRLTASIDSWITNTPMREFIGATNEVAFKTFMPGEVLYSGFSEELVHGVSSAGDYGRANVVLEFMVKRGGWDEERPLRNGEDGSIVVGGDGMPVTQRLVGYRRKPFSYLFAGVDPGSGVNE